MKITSVREQTQLPVVPVRARCPACGHEVEILPAAHAAGLLKMADETIRALVDAGEIHAIQTINGDDGVCRDSLLAQDATRTPKLPGPGPGTGREGEERELNPPDAEKERLPSGTDKRGLAKRARSQP